MNLFNLYVVYRNDKNHATIVYGYVYFLIINTILIINNNVW